MMIEIGERPTIQRKVYDFAFDEDGAGCENWSLSDYVIITTRGQLWGSKEIRVFEPSEDGEIGHLPFHCSMDLGFRLESTISDEAKKLLEERIATVYMGCLH